MRVIGRDNFDRDHISDILIANDIPDKEAHQLSALLNQYSLYRRERFYSVVGDDYNLHIWIP